MDINITEEELAEIEEITELAQGCTNYLLDSLVDPTTLEKIVLDKEDKKQIYKIVLGRTIEFIEERSFPVSENEFEVYVNDIFSYVQNNIG